MHDASLAHPSALPIVVVTFVFCVPEIGAEAIRVSLTLSPKVIRKAVGQSILLVREPRA